MRTPVHENYQAKAVKALTAALRDAVRKNGNGSMASVHEIQGILHEEMREFEDEVHDGSREMRVRAELLDIAVAAVFGVACIDAGTME